MQPRELTRWVFLFVLHAWALGAEVPGSGDPAASPALTTTDLRPQFEKLGFERWHQGPRNTCSVFTLAGALEFAIAKRQGHTPRLSVEFLNWAANRVCREDVDGGFFSDMWKGYSQYGICTAAEFPYQSKFDAAAWPPPEALADAKKRLGLGLRTNWIKEWDVKSGLSDPEFNAIKRTLSNGWPVCGGLRWPKQEHWTNNVLQMCGPEAVFDGHSVLIVGYRDDSNEPGGGVLIFRNTAGAGQDGFMPYAYALKYMNDAVWIDYEPRSPRMPATAPAVALLANPLFGLPQLSQGRNRRISSNEQPDWNNANMDMTVLPPGRSIEMPRLEGPGIIRHIWMTSHAGRVDELNALSLRIYWDDRAEPGVESPLGEFFAVGQGKPASVESVPVQVSPSGALSCYWPMPFAKSARIVVSNDNSNRTAGLYWQVDWTELDALPDSTPYFHAQYRQEYPAAMGQDYLVADLAGRGVYVGTVMSVTLGQDGWWGEGDDFFFIDGEKVPSLQGTGMEDYFNDAWGFRTRTGHWFGQPRWQGDNAGDSGVAYRWHLLDPVDFSSSLKVAFEHKGNRAEDIEGFYLERPDFISSVAFWYQLGEPKRFAHLPPYPERAAPWSTYHLVSALRQAQVTGKTKPRVDFAGMFGARPVVVWSNSTPGSRLSFPFSISSPGRHAVRLTAGAGPEYGIFDIDLDGRTAIARADFRALDYDELDLSLGTHELKQGQHLLSFRALAAPARKASPLAVELLRVLALPPEAVRPVKTANEAHFIRLGIGRAIYAYRLANGALPESLDALVALGLLPARFLADENNRPLTSRREGDYLVVKSQGTNAWTWRWHGLDARR
ncbi:MAG TPA: DUF2961 domain-containing protein [Verrucomicrobiae bacterium]|nr:DUF2961 domain-containing protein [Verrucomicrobiae bacterium]